MSPSKHTPGPWRVDPQFPDEILAGDKEVAEATGGEWTRMGEYEVPAEVAANARLIAAAPDLLAALEEADRLLTQCLTLLNNKNIHDHIPWGMEETVRDFVVNCVGTKAIALATSEKEITHGH